MASVCSDVRVTSPSSASQVRRPARRAPRVRLTRRGRVLVVLTLVALLLAAFSLGRTGTTEASTGTAARADRAVVTVVPGDTLWAIAKQIAPGRDPRPVVEQIRELNDLSGAELSAGQQLLLPTPA